MAFPAITDAECLQRLIIEERVRDDYRLALGARLTVFALYRRKRAIRIRGSVNRPPLSHPGWISAPPGHQFRVEIIATQESDLLRWHGRQIRSFWRVRLLGGPSPLRQYDLFVIGALHEIA